MYHLLRNSIKGLVLTSILACNHNQHSVPISTSAIDSLKLGVILSESDPIAAINLMAPVLKPNSEQDPFYITILSECYRSTNQLNQANLLISKSLPNYRDSVDHRMLICSYLPILRLSGEYELLI